MVVKYSEARRVEAMFQMAADGMPPSHIAQVANEDGWRTKVTIANRTGRKSGWPRCGRFMSPHVTHNGNLRYRHYRCRSHAGGRPPCKGSALHAFEIESRVAEWLADSGLLAEVPDLTAPQRRLVERFQIVWCSMNEAAQSRALAEVVERVEFDEAQSALSVTFDIEGIARLAQGE